VVLADGVVAESGPARAILDHPQHSATRELLRTEGREGI
jgi:ABC-type microcin C transport system duplicated ATPase subunit YejF